MERVWNDFASAIDDKHLATAENRAATLFAFMENIVATLHMLYEHETTQKSSQFTAASAEYCLHALACIARSDRSPHAQLSVPWSLIAMARTSSFDRILMYLQLNSCRF